MEIILRLVFLLLAASCDVHCLHADGIPDLNDSTQATIEPNLPGQQAGADRLVTDPSGQQATDRKGDDLLDDDDGETVNQPTNLHDGHLKKFGSAGPVHSVCI